MKGWSPPRPDCRSAALIVIDTASAAQSNTCDGRDGFGAEGCDAACSRLKVRELRRTLPGLFLVLSGHCNNIQYLQS